MKEDQTKELQTKEGQTDDQSLDVSKDNGWARCPICNEVWRTCEFRYPWYGIWDVEHYGLRAGLISEQLCPVHVETILVDGRIKGKRIILNQDELNEMTKNGLHCPVCKKKNLELSHQAKNEYSWTCNRCNASIITEQTATIDGNIEIKYCSYRKDLGRIKKKSFQDRIGIINSPALKVRKM